MLSTNQVLNISDALLEKEILPSANPQKESLAGDLLEKSFNQFCSEIHDELSDLNKKFTLFLIQS